MDSLSKKLLYLASHRGTKELDILIGRYMIACIDQMTMVEKQQFDVLLREPEPDLYEWLMGYEEAPAVYKDLIQNMRAFHAE